MLVPSKYMAIKDDIPGLPLNTEKNPGGSENPRTLPVGFDYEVPLSLNAETCLSEFRNVEKTDKGTKGKDGQNKANG